MTMSAHYFQDETHVSMKTLGGNRWNQKKARTSKRKAKAAKRDRKAAVVHAALVLQVKVLTAREALTCVSLAAAVKACAESLEIADSLSLQSTGWHMCAQHFIGLDEKACAERDAFLRVTQQAFIELDESRRELDHREADGLDLAVRDL